MSNLSHEPLLELFIFEIKQLLESLDQMILLSEESKKYSEQDILEIFRIMHTIKGSSLIYPTLRKSFFHP